MKVFLNFLFLLSIFFLLGCETTSLERDRIKASEYDSFALGKDPIWQRDKNYMQLVELKKNVLVDVVESNDVSNACARKMGFWSDGKQNFLGCATWEIKKGEPTCTVILPKRFQNVIFGHEIRHCFEASFHP